MKSIVCTECRNPIEKKNDLRAAGKLLQPYHAACLSNPDTVLGKLHKFSGTFPTGLKFWALIIIGNLFLGKLVAEHAESTAVLIIFAIIFNAVFLFARIGIYYSYERHLK